MGSQGATNVAESVLMTTKSRAPTLYAIIVVKLLKGALFLSMAIVAYTLSDNDLPLEYRHLLHYLRLNPERKFFNELAIKIGTITEANVLWVAAGTAIYSLFSLLEGVGLMFRVPWAGWMAIGESAFFIPIEVFDLVHHFSWTVFIILVINIVIVWYLFANRERLFHHPPGHHLRHED
jgi:uncharacterized membrane protein (DUF2068 family)